MALQLSEGSLSNIMKRETVEKPVLQILGNWHISTTGAQERYRLLVSDGQYLNSFAMLATPLNGRLKSGELADFTVVRVDRFITSFVNNATRGMRRVMIILELEVLATGSEVGMKLGSPQPLPEESGSEKPKEEGSASAPAPRNNISSSSSVSRPPVRNQVMSSPGEMNICPIASLNPYQHKWVIRARVFNKSPIHTWSNFRREGKLFSLDLVDESGAIRATAFNDQCDKFYDSIEVNNVYYISRCTLKTSNKKFTNCEHDYELTLTEDAQVIPCHEESACIPSLAYDFVPLNKLNDKEPQSLVDIIGVCKVAHDCQSIIARTTNKELKKRELLLVDETNTGITLTLWGAEAENYAGGMNPVVSVKNSRVTEFGGAKGVSVSMSSMFRIDPDIPEAHRLRGWYDSGGSEAKVKINAPMTGGAASSWMTLHEAKVKQAGAGDKAEYFTVKATVMVIKAENSIYKACPTEQCNKKVTDLQNGSYRCEKCGQEFPSFKYRILLSGGIADWTGKQWVTAFQEVGEALLGVTAAELGELQNTDSNKYQEVMSKAAFKSYIFRLRSKCETYNDETRVKTVVVGVTPINFTDYNKYLIEKIKKAANISTSHS